MVALGTGVYPEEARRRVNFAITSLRGAPPKELAWVNTLSPVHQRMFAVELYMAVSRLNYTGRLDEVIELLESWEATAEIDAAPEVAEVLQQTDKKYRDWTPTPGRLHNPA